MSPRRYEAKLLSTSHVCLDTLHLVQHLQWLHLAFIVKMAEDVEMQDADAREEEELQNQYSNMTKEQLDEKSAILIRVQVNSS